MFPSLPFLRPWLDAIDERWPRAGQRVSSIALAIGLELLLLLILLSLGVGGGEERSPREVLTTFDAMRDEDADERPTPKPEAAASNRLPAPSASATPKTMPSPPSVALPRPPVAPPITAPIAAPAPPAEMPANPGQSKIRAVIRSDMAGNRGPADTGARDGDSQRIAGSGPNGEPLYAARWYREPTDDEFRGYFARVNESAWALINCRTVPDFRVDQCVLVDEWPDRSGVGSAVLAMAWQFRVRPPRVGGRSMVGEWVRIRIDYVIRRN